VTDFVQGYHRGIITYLKPGTAYEVQVKQGSSYHRVASVSTNTLAPEKASGVLGTVDGAVGITRSGNTVTVTRNGTSDLVIDMTGKDYAEIHSGLVRNGKITLNADGIILRDIDVRGAAEDCIELAAGATDWRIIRCRFSGWGDDFEADGWGDNGHSCVKIQSGATGVHTGLVMGCTVASPRYSANTWEHTQTQVSGTGDHPWGAQFMDARGPSRTGRIHTIGNAIYCNPYRMMNDVWGATTNNFTLVAGGWGGDGVLSWNYILGAADDLIEVEGTVCNFLVAHNQFEFRLLHDECRSPQRVIGLGAVGWGPCYLVRNVMTYGVPTGLTRPATLLPRWIKMDRDDTTGSSGLGPSDLIGQIIMYHNLGITTENSTDVFETFSMVAGETSDMNHFTGRNNLIEAAAGDDIDPRLTTNSGTDVDWGTTYNIRVSALTSTNEVSTTTFAPAGTATALVGTAAVVYGFNDVGPWQSVSPDIGARESA